MVYLKFYRVEKEYNKDLFALEISTHQSQLLANKLSRHFKFAQRAGIEVIANTRTKGYASGGCIELPKVGCVGLTIHEVAHIWAHELYGGWKHNKKLHTLIKRLSSYFRKNLLSQFSTLEVPKPKAEPTPLQKYEKRLSNTHTSISRLTTKIKTLKTRLRTAKKKETYLRKQIRKLN